MRGGRIRTLLEKYPEFFHRALSFLGPQAALGQLLMKLGIGRIGFAGGLKILSCQLELSRGVVAHTQQGLCLCVPGISSQRGAECRCGRCPTLPFVLCQPKVEFDPGKVRIQCQRLAISSGSLVVFLQPGKIDS